MVQDLTDQKKLKKHQTRRKYCYSADERKKCGEETKKLSEVTDLCTFWNNFWRLTSFGPKLRETSRSQGNFRTDC